MVNSEYRSNRSVAKNPTIVIGVDDPRLAWDQIGLTKATIGAEIEIVGLNGVSLLAGGTTPVSPNGSTYDPVANLAGESAVTDLPGNVSDLAATWSGDNIVLTFTFDPSDSANQGIHRFVVKVRDKTNNKDYFLRAGYGYEATFLSNSSSEQTLIIEDADIQRTGIELSQNIDQVGVATCSLYKCNDFVLAEVPNYVSSFPKPVFTMTKGVDYYTVTLDPANLAEALTKNFYGIIIEEKVTTETVKANVNLTEGWVQASPITTNATSVIYTPDGAHRWVRVKYVAKSANNSVYSEIADITPDQFMPTNTTPPTNFNTATAEWQNNDIKVSFVRPSENAGTTIKVKLVPYVNDVESTSLSAFYYKILGALDTEFVIKSLDMYGQFGAYYSKFKVYVSALSAQGVESTSSISSGPITRANPLSGVYPTLGTPNVNSPTGVFRVSPISNGYVVDFDMPSGATRLEVYEKSTAWTVIPTNDNEMVYSGLSPATIITPTNDKRYVIVRFYDQYDNNSYYSMEKTGQTSGVEVTPIDVGTLSLIENPIKIQTDGSIFSGPGDETEYPQVFFNKDGLFAYDASGDWTTEIINSAGTNEPTFITKRAVIGDWTISPTAIQNDGYVSGSTYTGLSASGTYAFWAGASSSNNSDDLAEFSVTPAGAVTARKISIIGDGTSSDLINAGSGVFKVTNTGALTATSATITGGITVNQQSYFNANINLGSNGYLIATGTGTLKLGDEGILALNSGGTATTKIYSSPITVGTTTGVTLWSRKALFGETESSGWLISDGVMSSNYITLDSPNQELKVVSKTANSAKGISITAGYDSDYAIKAGNLSSPNFWVKHNGDLYAQNAILKGTLYGGSKTSVSSTSDGYYLDNDGTFNLGGPSAYIKYINGEILLSTSEFKGGNVGSAYVGYSQIKLGSTGTLISGLPLQGNSVVNYYGQTQLITTAGYIDANGNLQDNDNPIAQGGTSYMGMSPLGALGRQRMIVENPVTGVLSLGMAVYYQDTSTVHVSDPTASTGYVGDLWVQY